MKTLETKSVVLLHHHLKALRLPTIGRRVREGGRTGGRRQRRPPDLPAAALGARAARPGEAGGRAAPQGGTVPDHQDPRDLRLRGPAVGQQGADRRAGAL